jgi:hypothetical protein
VIQAAFHCRSAATPTPAGNIEAVADRKRTTKSFLRIASMNLLKFPVAVEQNHQLSNAILYAEVPSSR